MIRYGILSTASIIDRFIAGISESQDGYVHAIASRNIDIIYIPTVNGFHYRDAKNVL